MAVWTAVPYVNIFSKSASASYTRANYPSAIRQSIIQQLQNPKSPYVILVSPLLFETNQHELVNHTLLIDASEQTQIQRASQRDGQNQEQIQKIIAAQMPRERKRELANDIVFNDGLLEHLYQQLEPLHQSYLKRAN
ncbi:dephospho-CoA kinase [Acinetobacter baumannii]